MRRGEVQSEFWPERGRFWAAWVQAGQTDGQTDSPSLGSYRLRQACVSLQLQAADCACRA